uniref:Uncharacterized protein n=1 Tax=Chromera velia CCMP2878 TaxID=1169474 RepID=A0A0G4FTE0_9ALVE|eukprot:Cvel_18671.t1-p1 / transcript=Cvel_18671.t1 / gene=Cvel_18671 / organism=Chromera_velia_CCMP2878 / gene_product=hypothetical protein / transcript_product=hypothetical protein / location=Cvel_scaffold1561:30350-31237(-) / protein_length=296 / sequence_SO=supercontig / SO=protein_coding / is_pseudo=false
MTSSTLFSVGGIYLSLVGGIGLLCRGALQRKMPYGAFAFLTIVVMIVNLQYGLVGDAPKQIAWFTAIYDFPLNLGLSAMSAEDLNGVQPCASVEGRVDTCSELDWFSYHPNWAVDFYKRFKHGPESLRVQLYVHIWFSTFALVLSFIQFHQPTRRAYPTLHRWSGYAVTMCTLIGLGQAQKLGLDSADIPSYGANFAVYGWCAMVIQTIAPLLIGVYYAIQKDIKTHQRWMARYYGAMWGSFLAFRVVMLVAAVGLRHTLSGQALIAIYTGTPLGILAAEVCMIRALVRASSSKAK